MMNISRSLVMIILFASILLLSIPTQSMSIDDRLDSSAVRHKRWTFNTWRLHGRRQSPETAFSAEPYSPKATSTSDADHPYEFINHEAGEVPKMSERLAQLLQELNRKYEGNIQF